MPKCVICVGQQLTALSGIFIVYADTVSELGCVIFLLLLSLNHGVKGARRMVIGLGRVSERDRAL